MRGTPPELLGPKPPPREGAPSPYRDTFPELARRLHLLGLKDEELAAFFGVTPKTLYEWDNHHPEFRETRARGRELADADVAVSLYDRALGYSHDAVKIFLPPGATEPVYAAYTERYPPDTQAATWWLKNRHRDKWADRSEQTVNGEIVHTTPEQRAARIAALERKRRGLEIEGEAVEVPTEEDS